MMGSRTFLCDPTRLRLLLDGFLPEGEQAELVGHLDSCAACQRKLEEIAAESRWWGDARLLDGQAHLGIPGTVEGQRGRAGDEDESDDSDITQDVEGTSLGFLEPSEATGHLGRLGPYEVIEVIGRGGMGLVLKALDPTLGRIVAIKVLAPELATSATARRRFAREARAAAAVSHEHVVAIYAVDNPPGGLPYLVMPYLPGRSLQDRLDRTGPAGTEEVLRIGMQAASGLAAAHAQGLIHRDIKPSNILLENCVERVKITDFGLARAIDDASLTQSGVVAGTPQYMAPEQARGEPIDHRADLFSLGSVLYTLCTGRPPFRAETTLAVLRRVSEDTPRRLREVNPEVPVWLEAIVAKLHAKDPADRFQSAAEVADLLGRCLAHLQHPDSVPMPGLPSSAPPPRRRHWRGVTAAVLLMVIGGIGAGESSGIAPISELLATVLRIKTRDGTLVVQVDDPEVEVQVDGEDVVITGAGPREVRLSPGPHEVKAIKDGVPVHDEMITISRGNKRVVVVSRESAGSPKEKPVAVAPGEAERNFAPMAPFGVSPRGTPAPPGLGPSDMMPRGTSAFGPSDMMPRRLTGPSGSNEVRVLRGHTGWVRAVAATPDGRHALSAGEDKSIRLWDLVTGREVRRFEGHRDGVSSVAFSPDGRRVLSGSFDHDVRLWDVETGGTLRIFHGHQGGVACVAFSPDGRLAISGGGGEYHYGAFLEGPDCRVHLWEVETGRELRSFEGHTSWVHDVAFSPDGLRAASCGLDKTMRLWDVESGREMQRFTDEGIVWSVAFSPDGRYLLSASDVMRLWALEAGGLVREFNPAEKVGRWHRDQSTQEERPGRESNPAEKVSRRGIGSVAFSPDGLRVLSGSNDRTVRLWEVGTGRELACYKGHADWVSGVAFTPDGRLALSAGKDGTVRLWNVAADPGAPDMPGAGLPAPPPAPRPQPYLRQQRDFVRPAGPRPPHP